jgi:hypothetical protein
MAKAKQWSVRCMIWQNTTSMAANRRNFRFDGYRYNFGPHAWVSSREMMCRHGFITVFLSPEQQYRGIWVDAAGVGHWKWFATLKEAKQWVRMNATSFGLHG